MNPEDSLNVSIDYIIQLSLAKVEGYEVIRLKG